MEKDNDKLNKEGILNKNIPGAGIPAGLGFSLETENEAMENFALITPEERAIMTDHESEEEKCEEKEKEQDKEEREKSKCITEGVASFRILERQ